MRSLRFSRTGRTERLAAGALVTLVLVVLAAATGTAAAQSAPDCSTVTYNGAGTEANPYEIGNVDQLQCIEEQDTGANYVQVSDIDASETASWNSGKGFDPIGDRDTEFTGTFDGEDHTVSGLTINRGSFVGLFGIVDSARLENANLNNVNITGTDNVGGLVGSNGIDGTVKNSYANGDVSGTAPGSTVGNFVGGLVGSNSGGTITQSHATVDVSSSVEIVGGLVGFNLGGSITESYATGDVSGTSEVGGLVGNNGGTVERSYATGDVSGTFAVGGLVGVNDIENTVERSYATGDVSGTRNVGGLVGDNFKGTVTESYWDTESTGQSTSDGGTGLTTSEMTGSTAPSNMLGFDFTNTWMTVTNPDDYPILAWQQPTASFTLSTTTPGVGEAITFDASGSSDRDGSIQTYEWDFDGDGSNDLTRTVPLVTHTYSNPGTFAVTLTVTDDDGATDTATDTVTVESGGDGSLSPENPFGDSSNNPVDRSVVINRVVEWNTNGSIDSTQFARSEIINFVVQWNTAT